MRGHAGSHHCLNEHFDLSRRHDNHRRTGNYHCCFDNYHVTDHDDARSAPGFGIGHSCRGADPTGAPAQSTQR